MHRCALLVLVVTSGCVQEPFDTGSQADPVRVCPDGPTVEGIDVSKWQGAIDWDAVAASGVRYAFIRVNHGLDDIDEQFTYNWSEARRVGITRGAYQYFLPGEDAGEQAQLLLDLMGPLEEGDLPPVLDVEEADGDTPEEIRNDIHVWMEQVEETIGMKPVIYTAKYFWQDGVGMPSDFLAHPLWVANYEVDCPLIADPWSRWNFWQYTSSGSVSGISGNVDRDVFNGTEDDLSSLTLGGGSCGDGLCSGGETHESCAADCAGCEPIGPDGATIDEDGPCFEPGGSPSSWRWEADGWDGTLRWTYAWDSATEDIHGIWHLSFEQSCTYQVEVHTPTAWAGSRQAAYEIQYGDDQVEAVVDQTAIDGWVPVAELRFAAGANQWVRLGDNTGESLDDSRRLVFDAIRLTRVAGTDCDPSDGGGGDYGLPGTISPGSSTSVVEGDWQASDDAIGGCGLTRRSPKGSALPLCLILLGAWMTVRRRTRKAA